MRTLTRTRATLAAAVLAAGLMICADTGTSWADPGGLCGVAGCTSTGNLTGSTLSALGGIALSSTARLDPGAGTLAGSEALGVPPCWYQPGLTPAQAVQLARNLAKLVQANPDLTVWFRQYIEPMAQSGYHLDDKGLWYHAWCTDFNAPDAQAWTSTYPWFVWVATTDPAPAPAGAILMNPRTLAVYSIDSVLLPATEISRNPAAPNDAVVYLPTWIWLDPARFAPVSVTANAGPVTVTAKATPSSLQLPTDLSGVETSPASGLCTDLYDAYRGDPSVDPGCAITFTRSSAAEPGQAYPIAVQLAWSANYTSNIGDGGALNAGGIPGTAEIPVQELQSLIQ